MPLNCCAYWLVWAGPLARHFAATVSRQEDVGKDHGRAVQQKKMWDTLSIGWGGKWESGDRVDCGRFGSPHFHEPPDPRRGVRGREPQDGHQRFPRLHCGAILLLA